MHSGKYRKSECLPKIPHRWTNILEQDCLDFQRLFFDWVSGNRKADVVQTTDAVPLKSAVEPVQTFSLANEPL